MEIIKVENLNKFYGKKRVLKNINLVFRRGEISVIVGPNASGKTTFMKCLLGLVVPSSGKILFWGENIVGKSGYRRKIGYMPQIPNLPENLTPKDLFNLLVDIYGKDMVEKPERYIEMFSLKDFWNSPIKTLSGGTRQKVSATLCLSIKADVYLLDEPTASLDPKSSIVLKEEIISKKEKGAAVILTTHIIPTVEDISDNITYIFEGEVKYSGDVHRLKEITGEKTLERAVTRLNDVKNI
ncbi:MAG: ABC transporter ATP-binding protein [candidate division WOR-3 bacterium]